MGSPPSRRRRPEVFVLIRFPESWSDTVVATVAMILLALLDLGGAYAAKEAALRRSLPFAVLGAFLFLALFWVYASSLRYAELSLVTLGWVVLLQVGVVLLDRLHYGTPVSRGQWAAVAIVLAAQAYLLLAPASAPAAAPASAPHPEVCRYRAAALP
jgi:Zn-dependent protease with chaperone function